MRLAVVAVLIAGVGCGPSPAPGAPASKATAAEAPAREIATPAPAPRVTEALVAEAGERFAYRFRGSLFANLFYFVDCVSGSASCARDAFDQIAREELGGLSDDDRAALKTWKEVRRRYQGRITQVDDPDDTSLPLPHSHRQIERRARLAGYTSATPAEYAGKLATFVERADAGRAAAVLERFLPRFERYWQTAEPELEQLVASYSARVRDPALRKLVDRIAGFYDPDVPPGTELTFELILRPMTKLTKGEQLAHVSMVEVLAGEPPEERLGVVFHELFHYMLSQVKTKRLAGFVDALATSDDRVAYASYGVLDESLASAFGNGMVEGLLVPATLEKNLARKHGLYGDDFIDGVAKAILPDLDAVLARGVRLQDPAFSATYLDATHRAFAAGLPPRAVLRPFAAVYAPQLARSMDALYEVASSASSSSNDSIDPAASREVFDRHARWTRVLMMRHADLAALSGWKYALSPAAFREVPVLAKTRASLAYADLPKGQPALFVFVADTDDAMTKLLRRFGELPALRAGVLTE